MTRLDEIESRANAATEGPWKAEADPDEFPAVLGPVQVGRNVVTQSWIAPDVNEQSDAEFIAHARTDVPALAAVARFALSQHAPDGRGNCGPCDDAAGEDGWPCSTVREIHRLLGEDV